MITDLSKIGYNMKKFSPFMKAPQFWLAMLIFANLIIAALTLTHYGESWDEYNFFHYAEQSLAAYPGLFQPGFERTFSDPTLRHYGAWFLMICVGLARLLPNAYVSDVAHFLTFLLFQGGILFIYGLARRWLSPWAAFGAALLYATQPVFWGHAFINARDIPFQVGFIASIYFGLRLNDTLPTLPDKAAAQYEKLRLSPGTLVLLMFGMIVFGLFSAKLAESWLQAAPYLADTSSVGELDLYLRPILGRFWAGLIFLSLTLAWSAILILPARPNLRAQLWQVELRPYALQLQAILRSPAFWLATLALALTMGIRVMGVMAAGLVALHAFWRVKRSAFVPLVAYGLLSLVLLYPTWPYLWGEPLLRLLITFRLMTSFPWPGQVLFGGQFYAGNELPRTYLPTLFSIQLTEPLLLLSAIGLLLSVWKLLRKDRSAGELLILCLAWFGLPLGAALLGRPYLYDNFRQLLFILPPLFLLAGLGLDAIFERLSRPWLRIGLLFFAILPGLVGITSLHPYPYIYYNSLTGGTPGAFRQYEMDYWGTSFRKAAHYINQNAPQGAEVVVWGPPTTLWRYTRDDIRVYNALEERQPTGAYYALISTRSNKDLNVHTAAPTLYQVEKNGAILAVLRYIEP